MVVAGTCNQAASNKCNTGRIPKQRLQRPFKAAASVQPFHNCTQIVQRKFNLTSGDAVARPEAVTGECHVEQIGDWGSLLKLVVVVVRLERRSVNALCPPREQLASPLYNLLQAVQLGLLSVRWTTRGAAATRSRDHGHV